MKKRSPAKSISAVIVVIAIAVIGCIVLVFSRAATPAVSAEPENGVRSGTATVISDTSASGSAAVKFVPAASPSSRTQALLTYLKALPGKTSNKIISGQYLGDPPSINAVTTLSTVTGQWVGMIGGDYFHPNKYVTANTSINPIYIDYWNKGGLVTMSSHFPNPQTNGSPRDMNIDINQINTPGTTANKNFYVMLDQMSVGFQQLKQAGIVIIYRPLHEMNGNWFWWGGRDVAQYTTLWKNTHDYLVKTKGLDNLLFVYGPNGGSTNNMMKYYPGDAYVDIVGLDYYGNNPASQKANYDSLVATNKPFMLAEVGPGGSGTADIINGWDFTILLNAFKTAMPRTVLWQSWAGGWGMQNGTNAKTLLNDPWVSNRGENSF